MRLSRPLAPAAAVSVSLSHANSDAARLGLKPPRDHPTNRMGRDRASRHRHGASNPPTSRQVPSSPLVHNVMTIRSRSSSSKRSDDQHKTSPLHRTANNKVRKTNGNHQVNINSTIRIGPKPRASRPKYQGSPAFSTTPVRTISQVNRSDPNNCHAQQRKVLAKPKSQPIFKKALVNTFTNMIASPKTDDKTTVPPAAPNLVANVSHPELAPQSKQHHIVVPTSANLAKRKFVDTWIASQRVYTEARAARLARGVPPPQPHTSGNGIEYLVHSPLPFAPPMDHLPELESDVWSAGDLVDLQMGALRKQPLFGIPSDQENRRPDPLPGQAHHVTDIKATMPENGDMDDMALQDVGNARGQDDASSESSGRTVVPQDQDLNALPSLALELASSGKQSPPKALARQDSAVVFATVHIDSPTPFVVSHDDKGYRAVSGWAVVPCSDLSANGLGDEFLLV